MREKLADLCHRQWTGWMHHLFSKCHRDNNGDIVIPKVWYDRWLRQSITDYKDLSPAEMESDRKEADRFLEIMK